MRNTIYLNVLRGFVYAISFLPFGFRSSIGRFLGSLFSFIPTRDRLITKLQLKVFLKGKFIPQSPVSVRNVYANLGATLFESFDMSPVLKSGTELFKVSGFELAEELLDKKNGIVALTAHFGNWDLLAAYVINRSFDLQVIGRPAKKKSFQSILSELRLRHGVKTIWRGGRGGFYSIIQVLRNNGIVGVLIDQDTRVVGEMIPFFGLPAYTPTTILNIAKKQGSPVISCFLVREKDGSFTIKIEPFDSSLSTGELLEEFNRRLESIILKDPAQWAWVHKRWKTREDGKRLSSNEYIDFLRKQCVD